MGGNVRYGAALAARPEGPYVKTAGRIFESDTPGATGHWMLAEDPFLWPDPAPGGGYLAIARDVVGTFTGGAGAIALFQSPDGLHWKPTEYPQVLGQHFTWADGQRSRSKVERPALLFSAGQPIVLFGATDGYRNDGQTSFNVQIPLRVDPAP